MNVGLIGYGRFGSLLARLIARRTRVIAYDTDSARTAHLRGRIRGGTIEEAAAQPVVVLAVPISAMPATLRAVAPHVRPGALVMDVCSVKQKPVQWMERILPEHASILGTHPLFGPDTVSRSLRGKRIILCPVRITQPQTHMVSALLGESGLDVLIMTPDMHDRMMAETLLLTQYVGRLVREAGLTRWPKSTVTYDRLMDVVHVAEHDTPELFRDMWRFNPHARRLTNALERAAARVRGVLQEQ